MNRNRAPFLDPEAPKISARDKEAALGRRISGEKLPAPCDASALMSGIILKACSADPTDRFRTPGQMKVLLENQSDSDINTLGDLKNKTVGVLGGSKQYDLGSDSDIIEYTDITPMVNELKAGVIDAAVVDNTIGQFIIKNY